jgi:hypothetical protein
MLLIQRTPAALLALLLVLPLGARVQLGWADEPVPQKPSRPIRQLLTPENFPELHALICPHDNEWRHLRVDWLTDVVAARKKAAAEDKPLIICYTGGAGYNEPLGTC